MVPVLINTMTAPFIYGNMSERIDDLEINGFKIIQDTALFCYGMDAVLLSAFANASKKNKCLDLCTGNGIVPLLMYAKGKGVDWTGVELQKPCADLAKRNMELNNVSEHIEIVEGNLCDIPKGKLYISKRDNHIICDPDSAKSLNDKSDFKDKFDVVTCNPPYMKVGTGFKNPESAVAIARHEVECDFGDVAKACSHSLKLKGKAFFVHRPKHLISILEDLRREHLEPKRIQMVHSFAHSPATLVLIEGVKGGGEQLVVESPLIIYKEEGEYMDELLRLYGKLD